MPCYDAYKAERTARAKKQHRNPLIDKFGEAPATPTAQDVTATVSSPKPRPAPQAFQTKAPPPADKQPMGEPVQPPPAPTEQAAKPPSPAPAAPAAEVCDICKKPLAGFKVPLKGGKKVCMDCNGVLREVAKSLILNVQCPHCGKEIQLTGEQ